MPTFIYSPGIKVYIQTDGHGLVDVSEDLISGSMQRRSDGVSAFQFTLNNQRRKYDRVFMPNDRIIVMMKRIVWVRTFTGLLNSVPLVSAWPREVNLAASCSLKRLQYWYWDAHAAATQNLIRQALAANTATGTHSPDGGVTNVILTILRDVVGWPESKVHIGQIPADWFKIALQLAKQVDTLAEQGDAMAKQFATSLASKGVVAGQQLGTGKLPAGIYADISLSDTQLRIAELIFTVCHNMGGNDRDAVIGLATGMQESQLTNLTHGDRDSVGVFQQRPSQGWGSVAQIMDPTYAATKFFTGLLNVSNRNSMSEAQAAQTVQRSGYPDRYQKWVPMAQAIVSGLTAASGGSSTVFSQRAIENAGSTTGIAAQAVNNAVAAIGRGCTPRTCLETTQAFFGSPPARVATAALGYYAAKLKHPGDLNPPAGVPVWWDGGAGHVAVSIGGGYIVSTDWPTAGIIGKTTLAEMNSRWGKPYLGWTEDIEGIVITGIGPAGASVASGVGTGVTAAPTRPTTRADQPGYDPNSPFDSLFGNNDWNPPNGDGSDPEMLLSESLTGIRALLNDQPLLQYLKNSFYSTMRSYCSAPNGDLIAWFPDYYGIWGTAAKMIVQPIELKDFNVTWSDDEFVTHQFTIAGQGNVNFDISSGNIADPNFYTTNTGGDIRSSTLGIASIDIHAMMYAMFGIDASEEESKKFTDFIYKRFGARPAYNPMPGLVGPTAELFSAIFMFMRQWAYQYNADVEMTFMPEIWPGMLVQVPDFNFQAYVTAVTHTFQYGPGGGFNTTINIAAPARIPKPGDNKEGVLVGLPAAGGFRTTNYFTAAQNAQIDSAKNFDYAANGRKPLPL